MLRRFGHSHGRPLRAFAVAVVGLFAIQSYALPHAADAADVVQAGTATRGGLVKGARIIRIHNLKDDGQGSLRAALRKPCPCVIVFDVGGVIELSSDLRISNGHTTIAGQTAPSPGIFIRGAKIRISANDVVVQHISISPVTTSLKVEKEIDAIGVLACEQCSPKLSDIRLENVSAGWSTDEVIGLWGKGISGITIRNSLIAEGLDVAGHPKGHHSMGILIGGSVQGVEVAGNLFASNDRRNPVVGAGASAYVANNYVYNPGKSALHIYGDPSDHRTRATFIGNVVRRGPDTALLMQAVQVPEDFEQPSKGADFYLADNHCCSGMAGIPEPLPRLPSIVDAPPVTSSTWKPMPADKVWIWVSEHAGSRPRERSINDSRIFEYVDQGRGKIINNPADVGGYPLIEPNERRADVPSDPFAPPASAVRAETRLEAWLCLRHFKVGGPPTPECPDGIRALRSALADARPAPSTQPAKPAKQK